MRWEYKTLEFRKKGWFTGRFNLDELQSELNNLGRQGWELVATAKRGDPALGQGMVMFFKRPTQ